MNQTVIDTTKTAREIEPGMVYRYQTPRIDGGRDIVDISVRHVIPMCDNDVMIVGVETDDGLAPLQFDDSNQLLANWFDVLQADRPVTVLYGEEV